MQQRALGATGHTVSILGLGGGPLGAPRLEDAVGRGWRGVV